MDDDAHAELATLAALRAARRTGVLDALLDTADTPDAVAAQTDVDERTASVLVDVLTDRGFFAHVDGVYEPTNRALGLLTKTDLRSIGRRPHEIDRFDAYARLPTTIQSADPASASRTPALQRTRLGYVQATPEETIQTAVDFALETAPENPTILDLGGAPGPYATELAARDHTVTLRDTPGAIDAARSLLEPRSITLDPGPLTGPDHNGSDGEEKDFDESEFPPVDLVFASDVTPRLDDDALESMLAATHDALTTPIDPRSGGNDRPEMDDRPDDHPAPTLVMIEHIQGESPTTPTRRLDALATGEPGDCRTAPDLQTALQTAGFDAVEIDALPGLDRHAVTATPRST